VLQLESQPPPPDELGARGAAWAPVPVGHEHLGPLAVLVSVPVPAGAGGELGDAVLGRGERQVVAARVLVAVAVPRVVGAGLLKRRKREFWVRPEPCGLRIQNGCRVKVQELCEPEKENRGLGRSLRVSHK
jgi:hypothetical protein